MAGYEGVGAVDATNEQAEEERSPAEKALETIEIRQAQLDLVKSEVADLERSVKMAEKEEERKELQIYLDQRKDGQKEVEQNLESAIRELADIVLKESPAFPRQDLPEFFRSENKNYRRNFRILREEAKKFAEEEVNPHAPAMREFLERLDRVAPPEQVA